MICRICGKEFKKSIFYKPYDDICSKECYGEVFWIEKEEEYKNGKVFIIIDGCIYVDAGYVKNPQNTKFLGHSGREFNIKMNNGTKIFTNNLWCGGEIPDNHRKILCDNAIFI